MEDTNEDETSDELPSRSNAFIAVDSISVERKQRKCYNYGKIKHIMKMSSYIIKHNWLYANVINDNEECKTLSRIEKYYVQLFEHLVLRGIIGWYTR